MIKIINFTLLILFLSVLFEKSLQKVQKFSTTDQNADEKTIPYPYNSHSKIGHDNNDHYIKNLNQKEDVKHQILNYQLRNKRSFGNEYLELSDDFDEINSVIPVPILSQNNIDTESIPPLVMLLLAQKIKQEREREEANRPRVKTPRLGRDIEDEIDCQQRSRPQFSPRLGKKSVPFKPRLGRSYDDTKC